MGFYNVSVTCVNEVFKIKECLSFRVRHQVFKRDQRNQSPKKNSLKTFFGLQANVENLGTLQP